MYTGNTRISRNIPIHIRMLVLDISLQASELLTYEGNEFRSFRQVFGHPEHEHRKRQQHGDPHGDFLTGIRRKTKHQQGQGRHHNTREDHVVHVIQVPAPNRHNKRHIRKWLVAACVVDDVSLHLHVHHFPLAVVDVVTEVDLFRSIGYIHL